MDQVIFGKPAGQALREEAERRDAKRVFLIVSRTLNTQTDEIEKIRNALGSRYAGTFDGVPQHTTRASAVEATAQAAEAKADLVVAVGGGSVVDAAKIVLMCLEHKYHRRIRPRWIRTGFDARGAAARSISRAEGEDDRDPEHAVGWRV